MEEKTRGWTAGPWHVKDDWTPEGGLTVIANVDGEYDADGKPDCSYDTVLICEDDCGESLERSPHDAAFIAAANPQTILSLTQALRESMEREALRIVFDGPPGPDGPRLIEAENAAGQSVNAGEWRERPDGYWELVIAGGWRPIAEHDGSGADAAAVRAIVMSMCEDAADAILGGQSCP